MMQTRIVPSRHTAGRLECWCGPGIIRTPLEIKVIHRDPVGVVFNMHPIAAVFPKAAPA